MQRVRRDKDRVDRLIDDRTRSWHTLEGYERANRLRVVSGR